MIEALHTAFLQYGFDETNADKTCWIAYSGGLDSHVLLSLCHQLRSFFSIRFCAIHINHGLNPKAQEWALHCKQICKAYDIELIERVIHIELGHGKSIEEVAREKRYGIFAEYVSAGDFLLTAHHEDDQAETILLQLLRGAGPKGLAAMPELIPFAKGFHGRPFLTLSRSHLQDYAQQQQLKWIDDETNNNVKFMRNFIRHDIMPLLQSRLPSVAKTMARSAMHCRDNQLMLEEFSLEILTQVKGSIENTLSVEKLLQLKADKQRLVLRTWISSLGFPLPNTKKMYAIQHNVLSASWDKMPHLFWGKIELRRYRDNLYLMPRMLKQDMQHHFSWDFKQPLLLPNLGALHALPVTGQGLRAELQNVLVRFRVKGEVVTLPGRSKHAIKNLFQEWGIPPWERYRIPLIFAEDKLICVLGYYLAQEFTATIDGRGYELGLLRSPVIASPALSAGRGNPAL